MIADGDVIEQVNAQQLARFVQALRDALVFGAGRRIAAGVVVRDDGGSRTLYLAATGS